ncbi:MAG: regulatory protein RecX [Candidatus Saccharibacteria bacterium]
MKITGITPGQRNKNRVNISVDGVYRFSLDVYQLLDLKIRTGQEYSETELVALEQESQFGKAYGRALEYCLMRPHSIREIKDYLYRKTRSKLDKTGKTKPGITPEIAARVLDRLIEKGYVDDYKFANYWIENRSMTKGVSRRKLTAELRSKGIGSDIINQLLDSTKRNDHDEIQKIITKKKAHYPDEQKLMRYLASQGFGYDDIKRALGDSD